LTFSHSVVLTERAGAALPRAAATLELFAGFAGEDRFLVDATVVGEGMGRERTGWNLTTPRRVGGFRRVQREMSEGKRQRGALSKERAPLNTPVW
jgi:hypothetical protein